MSADIILTAAPGPARRITREALLGLTPKQLLAHEVCLSLRLDGKLFFKDEFFSILELLQDVDRWLLSARTRPYAFRAMEAEDGPLLAFIPMEGGFRLHSCWQAFDAANLTVSAEDLAGSLQRLYARWVGPAEL